jgi:hypothetical protein
LLEGRGASILQRPQLTLGWFTIEHFRTLCSAIRAKGFRDLPRILLGDSSFCANLTAADVRFLEGGAWADYDPDKSNIPPFLVSRAACFRFFTAVVCTACASTWEEANRNHQARAASEAPVKESKKPPAPVALSDAVRSNPKWRALWAGDDRRPRAPRPEPPDSPDVVFVGESGPIPVGESNAIPVGESIAIAASESSAVAVSESSTVPVGQGSTVPVAERDANPVSEREAVPVSDATPAPARGRGRPKANPAPPPSDGSKAGPVKKQSSAPLPVTRGGKNAAAAAEKNARPPPAGNDAGQVRSQSSGAAPVGRSGRKPAPAPIAVGEGDVSMVPDRPAGKNARPASAKKTRPPPPPAPSPPPPSPPGGDVDQVKGPGTSPFATRRSMQAAPAARSPLVVSNADQETSPGSRTVPVGQGEPTPIPDRVPEAATHVSPPPAPAPSPPPPSPPAGYDPDQVKGPGTSPFATRRSVQAAAATRSPPVVSNADQDTSPVPVGQSEPTPSPDRVREAETPVTPPPAAVPSADNSPRQGASSRLFPRERRVGTQNPPPSPAAVQTGPQVPIAFQFWFPSSRYNPAWVQGASPPDRVGVSVGSAAPPSPPRVPDAEPRAAAHRQ